MAINLDQDRKFKRVLTIGPNPRQREKIKLNFFYTLLCGASKGFTRALKAIIKPFEAPQRNVKMKI